MLFETIAKNNANCKTNTEPWYCSEAPLSIELNRHLRVATNKPACMEHSRICKTAEFLKNNINFFRHFFKKVSNIVQIIIASKKYPSTLS